MVDKNLWKQILLNEGAQSVLFARLRKKGYDKEIPVVIFKIAGDIILEQRSFLERVIESLHSDENMKREDMIKSIQKYVASGEYNYLSQMKGLEELEKTIDYSIDELAESNVSEQ